MGTLRYAAAALVFTFVVGAAGAQAPAWTVYKPTNTGLPGNWVYSLAIDAAGTVWATSDDPIWDEGGLVRFDGDVWESWTNVDGRSPTHYVNDLQFDSQGRQWVASEFGLLRRDGDALVTVWSTANAPWPTNKVSDFDWDSQGNLWVALDDVQTVRGGLARYDGTTWTVYTTANGLPWAAPWDNVTAVEIDSQDRVWFGSDVLGGGMFDGTNWTWLGVSGSHVTDIAFAAGGEPWFIFANYGIQSWNGSQWIDRTAHFNPYDVARVVLDREGFIWVTTYVGSMWRFNGSSWDISYSVPGLTHVYGLAFDSSNRPWVGGIGGLLHRADNGTWTRYTTYNTGLPSRWVDDAFVGSDGRVWFGTAGGGLSRFDGARWVNFSPYNFGTPPWPFLTDAVEQVIEGTAGEIWVATTNAGVGRWNGTQWTTHLPAVDVHSLTRHPSGDIWVAPEGGEVRRWDGSSWTGMGNPVYTEGHAITADALGRVWLATINGLMRWDAGQWTQFTTSNSGLPSNFVRALAAEPTGVVWIGTAEGLARFDGSSWTVYTEANSDLPADNVSSLAIAPDGALWVAAFNGQTWPYYGGVARFDGGGWTMYNRQNSPLPHEQVEGLAVDPDGGVWVATASEGVAYIHPNTTTAGEPGANPPNFALSPAVPNPARGIVQLALTLPAADIVDVAIYDALGRRMGTLHAGSLPAGTHALTFEAERFPAGVYLVLATSGHETVTRAVTVVR